MAKYLELIVIKIVKDERMYSKKIVMIGLLFPACYAMDNNFKDNLLIDGYKETDPKATFTSFMLTTPRKIDSSSKKAACFSASSPEDISQKEVKQENSCKKLASSFSITFTPRGKRVYEIQPRSFGLLKSGGQVQWHGSLNQIFKHLSWDERAESLAQHYFVNVHERVKQAYDLQVIQEVTKKRSEEDEGFSNTPDKAVLEHLVNERFIMYILLSPFTRVFLCEKTLETKGSCLGEPSYELELHFPAKVTYHNIRKKPFPENKDIVLVFGKDKRNSPYNTKHVFLTLFHACQHTARTKADFDKKEVIVLDSETNTCEVRKRSPIDVECYADENNVLHLRETQSEQRFIPRRLFHE